MLRKEQSVFCKVLKKSIYLSPQIRQLIRQCDTEGLAINALLPMYHCMHTPGGPLQYSLEGHPFAPFGVGITSNAKYLISVSNIFIIWDLTNGDVYRQVGRNS